MPPNQHLTINRRIRVAISVAAALPLCESALGQFSGPLVTNTRIRYVGSLLSAPGEPASEEGDQIGAFFEDQLIGRYAFTLGQTDTRAFAFFVSGDDPLTSIKEGPAFGDPIEFRFFDSSTNFVRADLAPVNSGGEVVNIVFEGQIGIDIPIIDLPDELLFPTADPPFDLLLGATPNTNDGANGGDAGPGQASAGDPDVDNNGKVDRKDAAMVIRIVTGSGRGIDPNTRARADVNGDGQVTTADAIAVLRAGRGG